MADDLEALDAFLANRQPLLAEFEEIVRHALSDDAECSDMRVSTIAYDLTAGTIRPSMSRLPRGRRATAGAHEWTPDRPLLVELAGRTIESRSRRWDPETQTVRPQPDDWRDVVRAAWPTRFRCAIGGGDGWCDLLIAAVGMISERGLDELYFDQIKEKLGSLRLYHEGGDDWSSDLEELVLTLSECICDICGRPGRPRDDRGWISTRCDEHIGRWSA